MAEFRYAIFGDPVERPLPQRASELIWRLSVQTDRVKWLFNPGPFELEDPPKWGPNEVVLRRKNPTPGADIPDDTKNPQPVQKVRFLICSSQEEAVDRLLRIKQPDVHFVPSIIDPIQQARINQSLQSQPMERWNLHYLGFRADRVLPHVRKEIAAKLKPADIRGAAGIPQDWGSHDMAPLDFSNSIPLGPNNNDDVARCFGIAALKFAYNATNELDSRVANAIVDQLSLPEGNIRRCDSYAALVSSVKNDKDIGMFLYNWYIQKPEAHNPPDAKPAAWRLLYPLFHSRCIGHTNLTHYDDGQSDVSIEAVLANPTTAAPTLKKIMDAIPMIALYHAVRLAAWRPSSEVSGLKLRDPDCQPIDRLKDVKVV